MQINLSRSFHPQNDNQDKCTIQIFEDMLPACVLDFKGNQDDNLPLIEFSYNNSYLYNVGIAPYEYLYGRKYIPSLDLFEVGESGLFGPDIVQQVMEQVKLNREWLLTSQSHHKSNVDVRHEHETQSLMLMIWSFLKFRL